MILLQNDYSEGAHERVLGALQGLGRRQFAGYSEDALSRRAQDLLRQMADMPQAQLHFVSGGTQANLTVIVSILRPHQGVIAADTGHIATHETGAVEATGHKVLAVQHADGKLLPRDIQRLADEHRADLSFEHTVQPGMVYVSNTTELGSLYSKAELTAISETCRALRLPLFLDGARLGHAMASDGADLSFRDYAQLCDVFTIGMTKQGTLFGEAIVLTGPALQRDFRYHIKQRGGMLAKGWLMAAQFLALMEDDLYLRLARHANRQAMRIRDGLKALGVPLLSDSPSNQQFPILPDAVIAALREDFGFNTIQRMDDAHTAVRFVTSWATREEDVSLLLHKLQALLPR